PGHSGSPVLDTTGRVIGLASYKAAEGEGLAFSIPADDLRAALAKAEAQGRDGPGRAESMHRLGVVLRLLVDAGRLFGEGLDPRPGRVKGASWPAAQGVRDRIKA